MQFDDLELTLVPEIGGRIMDIKYKGVSLLFQNPDLVSCLPDLAKLNELPSRAPHIPFPLWGGEKTWIAPDSSWLQGAPYPVLDSGEYSLGLGKSNSAKMISPICPLSGLQISRTINLTSSNTWYVRHQVTNKGPDPRTVGLWSVMMTKRPVSYFFRSKDGKIPTTVFGEPEDAFSNNAGIGQIECEVQREFKVGLHPGSGASAARIATENGAVWIMNRTNAVSGSADYAHGHAMEFYNSGNYGYGELEWHSPALLLQPGQTHELKLDYQLAFHDESYSVAKLFDEFESQDRVDE